jgi:hypothetical protein
MIWTKEFWKGLGERAIKTFFQAGVAAAVTAGIEAGVSGIDEVNWLRVLSVAALATVLSAATSVGNAEFVAGKAPVVVEPVEAPNTVIVNNPTTPPANG